MKNLFGFTLIELMVTLAVGIFILAIGVPSFMNMMSSSRAAGYANDLVGALQVARSEAVKRGLEAALCASKDQSSCTGASDWNKGWLVFRDDDGDGVPDAGETVVKVWSIPVNEQDTLIFESGVPSVIGFDASGANTLGTDTDLAFKTGECHGTQGRRIRVSRMGRTSLTHETCF